MMLLLIDDQNKEIYFSRFINSSHTFNPELPLLKLGFFIIKTVNVSDSKNADLEKLKNNLTSWLTLAF